MGKKNEPDYVDRLLEHDPVVALQDMFSELMHRVIVANDDLERLNRKAGELLGPGKESNEEAIRFLHIEFCNIVGELARRSQDVSKVSWGYVQRKYLDEQTLKRLRNESEANWRKLKKKLIKESNRYRGANG